MKEKVLAFLVGLFLTVGTAVAQNKITGTVLSAEDGEPIIGASVLINGTKNTGTTTNVEGKFTITVPQGKKLKISYIGMRESVVTPKNGMVVKLHTDATMVDEVVVTGIQKMDKRMFSGATAKIDADKAKLSGVADVSRSLEGRVAGVSVQNVSNTFGTAPKIKVRGATSIYGSNSGPLWVVDGVILENVVNVSSDDLSSGDATTLISNAIAGLNADDIESFDVLKDGSATSIYGARAMSGVVVITTKKGRSGQSSVNYTGEFTYRLKPSYKDYNISNSQEQMGIYKEMQAKGWLEFSALADGSSSGLYGKMYNLMQQYNESTGQFGLPYTDAAMNSYLQQAEFRNTNWFDLLFNNNIMQTHSVSISSGTEKANLYASVSAMIDPGWTKSSDVKRFTANVNASFNISKWLTFTLRTNASHVDQKAPGTLNQNVDLVSGAVSRSFDINPFSFALNTARTLDPNQTYKRNYADFNIFHELDNNYIDKDAMDVKFQGELSYKPIMGLEINLLGSYRTNKTTLDHNILNTSNQAMAYRAGVDDPNVMYNNTYLYTDPDQPNSLPVSVMPTGGIWINSQNKVLQLDFRGTVAYNTAWKDGMHRFNAMAGMEANRVDREMSENQVYGIDYERSQLVTITPAFYKQAKEEGTTLTSRNNAWGRRMAYFANVNYGFKDRYIINLTGRYDGSNQLGRSTKARWLPTWNVSPAWNISEEPFFKKLQEKTNNAFSYAKLRLSYSLTGEFPENLSSRASAYTVFGASTIWRPQGDQQETGLGLSIMGNENLTFEKKYEWNLGVDLGFFDNRLNIVSDFYWRNNHDLVGYLNTNGYGGMLRKFANYAKMKSHGMEVTISSQNLKLKDWKWSTDFTFSYTKTQITDLLATSRVIDLVVASGAPLVGYDHRSLFSIPFVGLNDEGIPQIINENGQVTTSDINFQEHDKLDFLKYEGPTEPAYTGGLNNTLQWKNWRLNVFFTYSFGNKIRLDPVFSYAYSDQTAMPKEFKNRWVIPGDEKTTDIPAIASVAQYYKDRYISWAYNAYNYSTARVAKGDFIRLKNISLTYDFSPQLISKIGLRTASLKFDATNIWLLYSDKKLNGMDPEFVNAGGVASPLSKQFTLTVRLGI